MVAAPLLQDYSPEAVAVEVLTPPLDPVNREVVAVVVGVEAQFCKRLEVDISSSVRV
jgi:hypothetical protein